MAIGPELERWLESVMLDEERLKQAIHSIESTFEGFNLSDEEKDLLRNPESAAWDPTTFPRMIIRYINCFNKENINLIARSPVQPGALRELTQKHYFMTANQTKRSD